MNAKRIAVLYAVAAAALYAVNVPISKLLLEAIPALRWILCALLLGFVAYGLSIHFYIMAQKDLGAAKTSAYYAIAPFLGVAFGMLILGERPGLQFYAALLVMIVSTCFMIKDTFELQHAHPRTHTHTHTHGEDTGNHDHRHRRMSHEHLHAC